jgi:RNA polymerase sigma-70 factor (ECF subfamily)
VGDVFLQVARNISSFNGDESGFRSWVFTIAYRRLIDERRLRGRRLEELTAEPPEPITRGPTTEEVALGRMTSGRLAEALEHLTGEQRQVLALRVLADLSVDEVAIIMGKRPGAVKALQRRAIATLRRSLGEGVS